MENVDIKVNVSYSVQGGEQAADTLNKVREKAKQATDTVKKGNDAMKSSFIESADRFGLFESQIGQTFKKFYEGSKTAVQSMGAVKGAIAATGIGLLVVAVGLLVANWDKLSGSVDAGTKAIDGSRIADEKAREEYNKHIKTMQDLQIEVDILTGKLTEHEAALKKITNSTNESLTNLENEHDKKLGKINSIWNKFITGVLNGNDQFRTQLDLATQTATANAEFLAKKKAALEADSLAKTAENLKKDEEYKKKHKEALDKWYAEIEKTAEEDAKKKETLNKIIKDTENKFLIDSIKGEREKALKTIEIQKNSQIEQATLLGASKKQLEVIENKYKQDVQIINKTYDDKEKEDEKNKQQELKNIRDEYAIISIQDDYDREIEKINQDEQKKIEELDKLKATEDEKLKWHQYYAQQRTAVLNDKELEAYQRKVEMNQLMIQADIDMADQTSTIFGGLGQIYETLGGKNKALIAWLMIIEKASSIASIIMNAQKATMANTAAASLAAASVAAIPFVGQTLGAGYRAAAIAQNTKIRIQAGISAGIVAATAGAQLAALNKMDKKATGGWIGGQSHANGGTVIEAEKGEYVVRKEAMANPQVAQSVVAMNNGATPASSTLSEERMAQIASVVASNIVKSVRVYVVESDITTTQRKVQVRESPFIR